MWANGSTAAPFFIVAFYVLSHYCMAVTMFKELDMREVGGAYFSDMGVFAKRLLDVLFYDIQMAASVVHSNSMLEGMTQVCGRAVVLVGYPPLEAWVDGAGMGASTG